jgi:hypothetical protein
MKRLLPLVFFVSPFIVDASHLAGGEFQIKHVNGYVYKITLILYFDLSHGNPGARDANAAVRIFRSSDNSMVRDLTLPMTGEQPLSATSPICVFGQFYLSAIYYTSEVTLDPATFNDPSGYYVAWERCCRNYELTNIYSEEPNSANYTGKYAGQTFLMHFPPVVVNGNPFPNSSPRLLPPTLDWATIGKNFVQNYRAVDDDGDSLVYSLTNPLSTHSADPLQPQGPGPKPYPTPTWKPGYGPSNFMQGNPDLHVSSTGRVTVTATHYGTFAFAIRVEEYRNKVKIGEVIRDFQFMAVPASTSNAAPEISFRMQDGSTTVEDRNLQFAASAPVESRCLTVTVTDPTVQTYPFSETVRLGAVPIGFDKPVNEILPVVSNGTLTSDNPSLDFTICFERCPPASTNQFRIGIVVYDGGCSIPGSDTVFVNVTIDIGDYCQTQTIDFPQPADKLISDGSVTIIATASSGLPVSFSSTSLVVGSINSSSVTFQAAGRAMIQAQQSGNEKYFAAEPVTRSFCVNPLPPSITLEQSSANIVLVVTESTTPEAFWYKNGIQLNSEPTALLEVTGLDGEFTARSVADDCLSEASNSILISGMDDSSTADLNVFPNPAGDFVTVLTKGTSLEISNLNGVVLIGTNIMHEPIFIGDLATGMYFVKVKSETGFKVKKLFKK